MKVEGKSVKLRTQPKRTAIGHSVFSRPKNKHKRRQWKPYVGQGARR